MFNKAKENILKELNVNNEEENNYYFINFDDFWKISHKIKMTFNQDHPICKKFILEEKLSEIRSKIGKIIYNRENKRNENLIKMNRLLKVK